MASGIQFNASAGGGIEVHIVDGAVSPGTEMALMTLAAGGIDITIADAKLHSGFFILKDTASTSGACTCTITTGSWDGTNTVATTNAANDLLMVWFDEDGAGTIILNTGSVALS